MLRAQVEDRVLQRRTTLRDEEPLTTRLRATTGTPRSTHERGEQAMKSCGVLLGEIKSRQLPCRGQRSSAD